MKYALEQPGYSSLRDKVRFSLNLAQTGKYPAGIMEVWIRQWEIQKQQKVKRKGTQTTECTRSRNSHIENEPVP